MSWNENMDVLWADNFTTKNWWKLPFCNPKADLDNINAHTKFGENPLTSTRYRSKMKILMDNWQTDGQADGQMDRYRDINMKP